MKKARPKIPKAVAEKVLREFNHLCSVCAAPKPHLHHIDENRENNDPLNILPLCPNCHLTDQHNPTSKIRPGILALFREFKDPTILTPQFEPIFSRLERLSELISERSHEELIDQWAHIWDAVADLVEFVGRLEMGHYYCKVVKTKFVETGLTTFDDSAEAAIALSDLRNGIAMWPETRGLLNKLLVEMLRYQSWNCTPSRFKRSSRSNSH